MVNSDGVIRKFSALDIPGIMEGEKSKMPEILNRRIIITRAEARISNHINVDGVRGQYKMIQFYFADDPDRRLRVVFTSSKTIISQIDNPRMAYPCEATVKMVGKGYCLT